MNKPSFAPFIVTAFIPIVGGLNVRRVYVFRVGPLIFWRILCHQFSLTDIAIREEPGTAWSG
jgi:hypothetical protein